ncbi:hypothetical protein OF83DRAFT_1288931 [Amylostereum chailletii]|nr:hypothetical protein OF83DRAFT_1288931 [Amylostereum chailletii]
MAYTPTGGPATSTPNPQAPATAVQPTTRSKTLAPEPDSKLSSNSRDTVSYLESATDTKLNQDELQTWLAVDLEHPNFCIFDRLLNHMLSLRVPDGLTIDNDILLDKCLKDVLPICHLEEVINCIKA